MINRNLAVLSRFARQTAVLLESTKEGTRAFRLHSATRSSNTYTAYIPFLKNSNSLSPFNKSTKVKDIDRQTDRKGEFPNSGHRWERKNADSGYVVGSKVSGLTYISRAKWKML